MICTVFATYVTICFWMDLFKCQRQYSGICLPYGTPGMPGKTLRGDYFPSIHARNWPSLTQPTKGYSATLNGLPTQQWAHAIMHVFLQVLSLTFK